MDADERRLKPITEKIIGCCYTVGNILGHGFLEKVYERALQIELTQAGLHVARQKSINIRYKNVVIGEYVADMLVEDCVLVEIKAIKQFDDTHLAQCLNYLKATRLPLGLLVNFGAPKVQIRRVIESSHLRSSASICG